MLDFKHLAIDHRIPIIEEGHHHTHQGWIQTHCPFCAGGRGGWHLGFSTDTGIFSCWRCGSLKTLDVLSQLLRSDAAGRAAMGKYQTGPVGRKRVSREERQKAVPPPEMEELAPQHRKYLQSRKFRPDHLVKTWGLKCTRHLSLEWNWRLVFPIQNCLGDTMAYCGRSIHPDVRPKYKMSHKEEMRGNPSALLYGIQHIEDKVVVVEGPADVWRLGPGAVAVLGIDWKKEQALTLSGIPHRIIMFDADNKAQRKALQLAEWLNVFDGVTELISEIPTDPGNLTQPEADAIMRDFGFTR